MQTRDPELPSVAHISVFPAKGHLHSAEGDISALAGYLNSLLSAFPAEPPIHHVVLTNRKTTHTTCFRRGRIVVVECWRRGSPTFFLSLLRVIQKNPQWRVVHLQHEFNQFGGVLALPLTLLLLAAIRLFCQRKVVVTVHEVLRLELLTRTFLTSVVVKYPVSLTRFVVFLYYYLLGRAANVLIAQDEVFAKTLEDQFLARAPVKIIKIGTSIAEPANREMSRARWQVTGEENVTLFFGTLDWRKGIDCLLDAWMMLPKGFGTLLIAGGTPTRVAATPEYRSWRSKLERRARSIPSVHFTGFVDDHDLPMLFGAADLVVLPYIVPQRVSAVFNQAASFGKPLIASDVFSGQADPDMLFKPEANDLADKLRWAFAGNLESLRQSSVRFREKNSWAHSAMKLAKIYQDLTKPTNE